MKRAIAVCNSRGEAVGEKDERRIHELGLWHSSSHVWIYTRAGDILFQERALSKLVYPGLLDISAAGHVQWREEPAAAAMRETFEELGVRLDSRLLRLAERGKFTETLRTLYWLNNEFYYLFFYGVTDKDQLAFNPNMKEVRSLKFVPVDTVRRELVDGKVKSCYVPHGKRYYSKVAAWVESHRG